MGICKNWGKQFGVQKNSGSSDIEDDIINKEIKNTKLKMFWQNMQHCKCFSVYTLATSTRIKGGEFSKFGLQ